MLSIILSSFALCGSPQRTVAPLQHRPPAAQRCQMMLLVHLIIHLSPQHILRIRGLLHCSSLNVSLQVKAIFNSNDDAFIQGVLIIVQFAEYVGSATRKVPLRGKMQLSRSRIFLGKCRSRIGSSQSLSAAQEMALLWLKQPLLVHLDFKRHKNYGFFCEVEIKILSRNVRQIVDLFLFPPQLIYWRFSTTSISLCRTSHLAEIKISRARCFCPIWTLIS